MYNFHLAKVKFPLIYGEILIKISDKLNRKLNDGDFELIELYGVEAFFLSSFLYINELFLKQNWVRMNRIWFFLNQNLIKKDHFEQKKYINLGIQAFNEKRSFVVITSLDHCLKFIKNEKCIDFEFYDFLKLVCPLIIVFFESQSVT